MYSVICKLFQSKQFNFEDSDGKKEIQSYAIIKNKGTGDCKI